MPENERATEEMGLLLEAGVGEAEPADLLQEIRHDSLQSIATILTLVAAGKEEVGDRDLVLRRLDQVAQQTRALAGLLDEAVSLWPRTATVDVSAEASDTVRALTASYGGRIRFVADSETWAAFSPASMRRVLTNVLINALRAAGEGGAVQVKVFRNGGRVVVEVEDDGPGFGHLEIIHGVGLRSTRRLLRSAGGTIDVGTGLLGGALVRVSLPATELSGGDTDEDPAV